MAMHTFDRITWETEAGRPLLSLRLHWSGQTVLHTETSLKNKTKRTNHSVCMYYNVDIVLSKRTKTEALSGDDNLVRQILAK